jgi:hypothetical protein
MNWPTPDANASTQSNRSPSAGAAVRPLLAKMVQTFHQDPTTTPHGKTCWCENPTCDLPSHKRRLNPWFTEALMGFPPDWTALPGSARLAMPLCRPALSLPLED